MSKALDLIKQRIEHWKSKRELLKHVSSQWEERHYVQGKLNELQYLKKNLMKNKFQSICPHCQSPLCILTTDTTVNTAIHHNMPSKTTPFIWPHSENENGEFENYQVLTCQTRCHNCGRYYNLKYSFDYMEEVTEKSGIWYDAETAIKNWTDKYFSSKEDSENMPTRRSCLDKLKGLFKIGLK